MVCLWNITLYVHGYQFVYLSKIGEIEKYINEKRRTYT